MTRKFVAHLGFLIFVNLLIKPFWIFGIDRVVQNEVGTAEYGNYFSLYNFSVLLYVLLDFGISNFNNREVSVDKKNLMENLGTMFLLKFILSGVYLFITLISAYLIGYQGQQLYFLLILCLGQVFLSFLLFFRSGMAGLQAFKEDAILSISDRLLMIFLVGGLLLFTIGDFKIQYFVFAQTISWGIAALVAFSWLLYKAGTIEWSWETKSIMPLLQATAPFAFIGLLMSVYSRIDAVMIERMLGESGAHETGVYAAAFRLLDAVNMFAYLFASLLLPMFANMLAKKESIVALLGLSTRLLAAMALVLCIATYFYGEELMYLLYPAADLYYSKILFLLFVSFLGTAMVYVFGTLLLADNKLKWINIIAFTGMVLNIAINFMLIPKYGAYGAALATLATQVLVGFSQIILVWHRFEIPYRLRYVFQTSLFIALLIASATALNLLSINWVFKFSLWLISALAIGFLSSFLPNINKWKIYLKK